MTKTHDQRQLEERTQETRLVRGAEAAYDSNADTNSSRSSGYDVAGAKHQQVGNNRTNDQREDARSRIGSGDETAGKILERLKLLENQFLAYVRNDQQRLEARLDESRTAEQNFFSAVKELEHDITSFVDKQERTKELSDTEVTHTEKKL